MSTLAKNATLLDSGVPFARRHIGPGEAEIAGMLRSLDLDSLDALIQETVPGSIRMTGDLALGAGRSEQDVLQELRELAGSNQVFRNYIGLGYSECVLPPAIQRGILENPGWYTAYTPYQPEISQGRLEALLNFQTMIKDLTALPVANASLLDEGTAAAEAMTLCSRVRKRGLGGNTFFVSESCHPQTIAVVQARAEPLGILVEVGDHRTLEHSDEIFGALVQYPDTDGTVHDYRQFCADAHSKDCLVVVAADLLALTILAPPGEYGADIAVGTTQRFGVPMGFGGPHAAYMAAREQYKRQIPGRLVGLSRDADGNPAVRLALQTREQHIRRDKATSNICTSQVLLAVIASMYAVYHGPSGLKNMALRIRSRTTALAAGLSRAGHTIVSPVWFDTLRVRPVEGSRNGILEKALARRINLRFYEGGDLGVSLAETTSSADLGNLAAIFDTKVDDQGDEPIPEPLRRKTEYLTHPVFHLYRSETELMRYMHRLERKDLALNQAMIPLGSCTMKLNATAEMLPVTWPEFAALHPFAPPSPDAGYDELFDRSRGLAVRDHRVPGGLAYSPTPAPRASTRACCVIRAYHRRRGERERDVCLIPDSAHGTNPASAVMAGMRVVAVNCDEQGNIDLADLEAKAAEHSDELAALMVTYPSTHGVFEEAIRQICDTVHRARRPGLHGRRQHERAGRTLPSRRDRRRRLPPQPAQDLLHPARGRRTGDGPDRCRVEHLAPFLPGHPVWSRPEARHAIGPISAAPFGSPSILPISWAYIAMMGADGLKRRPRSRSSTPTTWPSAGRPLRRCSTPGRTGAWPTSASSICAVSKTAGITVDDVAKRLIDYGFHAPTMSCPVAGTLMVEPTESESKAELDRFCDAMIAIREEVAEVETGAVDAENNVLLTRPPHRCR